MNQRKTDLSRVSQGFTLIEIVVVVLVGAILVIGATNLFVSSLYGGGKAGRINYIKETGDHAISQMERLIRDADGVDTAVSNCTSGAWGYWPLLQVNYDDGTYLQFRIVDNRLAMNDGSGWSYLTAEGILVEDIYTGDKIFWCIYQPGYATLVSIRMRLRMLYASSSRPEEYLFQIFTTQVVVREF